MNNTLIEFKDELKDGIKVKTLTNEKNKTYEEYIYRTIEEIKEKYFKFISGEIKIQELQNYINSIDKKIIFEENFYEIKKDINELKNKKIDLNKFNITIASLRDKLIKLVHNKHTTIIMNDLLIEKMNSLVNNIDNNGNYSSPLSLDSLNTIQSFLKYSTQDQTELLFEIIKENNNIIEKRKRQANAKKLITTRKINKKTTQIKTTEVFNENILSQQEKILLNNAKEIINEQKEIELIDIENTFIEDLKNITNIKEINECMDCMDSDKNRINIIIGSLKYRIDSLNNNNYKTNIELIKEYIKIYNKLKQKIQKNNIENERKQKELNFMMPYQILLLHTLILLMR